VNGDYDPHHPPPSKSHPNSSVSQIRPANVFYTPYAIHPTNGLPSVPPQLNNGMESHFSAHTSATIPASTLNTAMVTPTSATKTEFSPPSSPAKKHSSLLKELDPGASKRTYVVVHDHETQSKKVRVKIDIESVQVEQIPDSYRRDNSVYPRSFFPAQMVMSPREKREKRAAGRFDEEGLGMGVGSTLVKIPMVDVEEREVPLPRMGKNVGEREERLNDLGYRISWEKGRHYAGRVLTLQRSSRFPPNPPALSPPPVQSVRVSRKQERPLTRSRSRHVQGQTHQHRPRSPKPLGHVSILSYPAWQKEVGRGGTENERRLTLTPVSLSHLSRNNSRLHNLKNTHAPNRRIASHFLFLLILLLLLHLFYFYEKSAFTGHSAAKSQTLGIYIGMLNMRAQLVE